MKPENIINLFRKIFYIILKYNMSFIQLLNVGGVLQTQNGSIGGTNNNLPTWSSTDFTGSMYGNGISGGSNSNYISTTLDKTVTDKQFTIEFWMKPDSTYASIGGPFSLGSQMNSNFIACYYNLEAAGIISILFSSGGRQLSSINGSITNGAWNHIAITRDVTNVVSLFINGVREDYYTNTGFNISYNNLALFRVYPDLDQEQFKGNITGFSIKEYNYYNSNFIPNAKLLESDSSTLVLLNNVSSVTMLTDSSSYNNTMTNHGTPGVVYQTEHP